MEKASGQNDQKEGVWDKDTERALLPLVLQRMDTQLRLPALCPSSLQTTRQNSPGTRPSALDRLKVSYP